MEIAFRISIIITALIVGILVVLGGATYLPRHRLTALLVLATVPAICVLAYQGGRWGAGLLYYILDRWF